MGKTNCWEFKKCGREPGGSKVAELGVCPACTDTTYNGLNNGENGGRICWAAVGTFCGGKVQGGFAQKETTCLVCDFFLAVKEEEAGKFGLLQPGQVYKPAKR